MNDHMPCRADKALVGEQIMERKIIKDLGEE